MRRTESSIRELEALFALPDLREIKDLRERGSATRGKGLKPITPSQQ